MLMDFDGFLAKPPIVTLYFVISLIIVTSSLSFRVLNPRYIILDWLKVYKSRQVWRILTNYFYIGPFSLNWLISAIMFTQFSTNLENNATFRSKGSYLYFIFLQMNLISVLSLFFYWPTGYPFLFQSLHFSVLYYWSKMEKLTPISIYFFRVKAYQMPIILFVFHLFTGGSIINDAIGLLAGHLYYYINDLSHNNMNTPNIKTPQIFDKIVSKMENLIKFLSNEYDNTTRAFRGRGMRLN